MCYTVRGVVLRCVEIQPQNKLHPDRIQALSGKILKYCERFYSKLNHETRSKGDFDCQQFTVH